MVFLELLYVLFMLILALWCIFSKKERKQSMETRYVYRPEVQHRELMKGKWILAFPGRREYNTYEEAKEAIKTCMEENKPRTIKVYKDGEYFPEYWDANEVIAWRVRTRLVSDWCVYDSDTLGGEL